MRIAVGEDDWLGPWMTSIHGGQWIPGAGHTIGLIDDNEQPLCVVGYEQFNGANIQCHISAVPGKRWLNREFLWYGFYYPFVQLGVKRITGLVPSSNLHARAVDEHLGFTLEATLKDAHPDGDLLVYCMTKDQCRWLNLKDRKHGQLQTTPTT